MTIQTTAADPRPFLSVRERQRVEHLVLGMPRPAPELKKPEGMDRLSWKLEKARLRRVGARLAPGIEEAVALQEAWRGIQGTPETLEREARSTEGVLARLCKKGTITANQLAAAEQIRECVASLIADVGYPTTSWEARVDGGRCGGGGSGMIAYRSVRWEMAYSRWRSSVTGPISMLLEMIVDGVPYSAAAPRYRMSAKRAKRLLLDALDAWWRVSALVGREADPASIAAAQAGLV